MQSGKLALGYCFMATCRYEGLDREAIGIKSKRILDYGRMAALTKLGYNTQLVTYIPRDVSLENVMLIASPSPDRKSVV